MVSGTNNEWGFDYAFEQFERFCRIKNLRERTVQGYRENYNKFVQFMNEYTIHNTINSITQYDVDNYILYLRGTGMKDTSVNSYLRGIRAILNFFTNQDICVKFRVPICKADKSLKETYTDDELYKLLQKPNISKCSFIEYRNWCIINFFIATGVRVSTLVNIKIQDLDFEFDRIHLVFTKNRKSYIVPMSAQLKEVMKEYLLFRKGEGNDYLFCNPYGEQATTDSVKHAISRYNKARGVNKTGLHMFRHTFAKKCVLNNVNVFVLQRLLGHSDINVTKEYVNLYSNDLAIDIEKYNPLDTLGVIKPKPKEMRKNEK